MSIVETSGISVEVAVPTSVLLMLTSVGWFGLGRSFSPPLIRRAPGVPGWTPGPTAPHFGTAPDARVVTGGSRARGTSRSGTLLSVIAHVHMPSLGAAT